MTTAADLLTLDADQLTLDADNLSLESDSGTQPALSTAPQRPVISAARPSNLSTTIR